MMTVGDLIDVLETFDRDKEACIDYRKSNRGGDIGNILKVGDHSHLYYPH